MPGPGNPGRRAAGRRHRVRGVGAPAGTAEVMAGDLRLYDPDGTLVGELNGYTIKRATRAALLAAVEGGEGAAVRDRVARPRAGAGDAAGGFPDRSFRGQGRFGAVHRLPRGGRRRGADRAALLEDLELLSRRYAIATLDALGWERTAGAVVDSVELRGGWRSGRSTSGCFAGCWRCWPGPECWKRRTADSRSWSRAATPCPGICPPTLRISRPGWRRGTRTARTRSACSAAARTRSPTCCADAWTR